MSPNPPIFSEFFGTENTSSEEVASTWEGVMSIDECERSLKTLESNKTPDTDGLTFEFYRCFWNLLGSFMVSSFNCAFRNGSDYYYGENGAICISSILPLDKVKFLGSARRLFLAKGNGLLD